MLFAADLLVHRCDVLLRTQYVDAQLVRGAPEQVLERNVPCLVQDETKSESTLLGRQQFNEAVIVMGPSPELKEGYVLRAVSPLGRNFRYTVKSVRLLPSPSRVEWQEAEVVQDLAAEAA